ncbi:MAG TPA: hypothetical protein VG935_01440, partial [Patescibacteria group bacterium]|nr:hypothetical protein [Patescibacteria group bacterium]
TTRVGHVVGLYLRSPISPQQPLDYTIEAIHDQGGLVIAVHPLALRVKGIGIEAITSVINHPSPDVYFDGFEVYNAGLDIYPPLRDKNAEALALYQELLIDYADKIGAAVGSSDSHFYPIGAGRTWYNGDLREALARRETIVTSGYTGGKFEGLNAAYREFGPKAFDRYWELKKRNL